MLHTSDFLDISPILNGKAIKIQWLPDSYRMTDEIFQKEIEAEKNAIETAKPQSIFADTLQMKFSIPPELQQWHNNLIFPSFNSVGVKKLAILVSHDIFVQVSIEQLIDEGATTGFITKYFDSEASALEWINA
jgi:hypothetical protein